MMDKDKYLDSLEKNIKTFEATSVVMIVSDLEDRILFISDAAKKLFDLSVPLEGKTLSELYPTLKQKLPENTAVVRENDFPHTIILTGRNDEKKWISIDKQPFTDNRNKVIGSIMYLTDITAKSLLHIETEQLNQILNAHIRVEEILKNTTDAEKFTSELSASFVEKNIFSAVLVEYFHNFKSKEVSQYACWIDKNNQIKHLSERKTGFTKCFENYLQNKEEKFLKHNTPGNCPWHEMYSETNSYVSEVVYGSKVYGSICIRLNDDWQFSDKIKFLLDQLTAKIAFGFYSLETQKQINTIQEEMEEQLKLYKRALDVTNDGVWDWNLQTDEVFYSDRYFTMLGFDPNDFPKTLDAWKSLIHHEDIDYVNKIIQMEIESKSEGFEVEFRMRTKTENYLWILERGKVYKRDTKGMPLRIIGTHVDITDLKEQEKELEQKNDMLENINEELSANNEEIREMNKELEKLYKEQEELSDQTARMLRLMGQISLLGTNEKTFLEECLDLVFDMISATTSGKIIMFEGEKYTVMTTTGTSQRPLEGMAIKKDSIKIPEKVKLLSKEEIISLFKVDAFAEEKIESSLAEVKESIFTPIIWSGAIRGCIEIYNENSSEMFFKYSDLKRMTSFSNLLSIFYRLRKYMKDEGKFQTDLILTLVKALEYYDAYTRGHSERVAIWSAELAKALGVDEEGQKQIYFVSLMHDIGKIFIPQNILNKAGRLTEDEYTLIQSHSTKSAELINKVEGMENFAKIVLHHHEKYDGTGYPDRLKGKVIPYFSRIISVADSYDAMTSKRPYRKILSEEFAVQELRRCSGTQFDPSMIEPFIEKVLKNKKLSIPKE
ncbi:MAG TPA: PAS domain-containing protein [Thermotogota bacterium]|nr:PAS domain-containing protein [Thermotogota bacterium]HPJ88901.1 PAS domain-containing protein [Thermotogota bacterium]HPR95281.1 PAS domain-containing protein [Thermotogota bacterium]